MSLYEFDKKILCSGNRLLCGVDEAGRGPLAGPVCAAAVILDLDNEIIGINDSKKLSEKKREELYEEIINKAIAWSVSFRDEKTIDDINILNATMAAMKEAVESLGAEPDIVLIDGNKAPDIIYNTECVIHGDAQSASIAAASIIAKVTRDRYMMELDKKYPQYCFAKHKGYGTKLHYEKIDEYGISEVHRRSFLKKYL